MSNPEPLEKLLQQMNDRLQQLADQAKQNQPKEPLPSTEKPTPTKHAHSANVEFDCPECQKEYNATITTEAVADFKQKVKKMKRPVLCDGEDCGEIYDAEEKEDCPTCHRHE